ncbi:MAG: transglycosylase domain-containing protein [Candidatus Gracilibacteria bacterium]|nr:transglycosylase domain-containing protein [Candidatus Gracilibacteria bacterium]
MLMFLVAFGTIGVIIAGVVLYYKMIVPLPPVTKLREMSIPQSSEIYDRDGNLLYSVFKEKRTYVEYEKINKNMINAIVAGEDKRFWTNPGFDLIGLTRAALTAIMTGETPGGTSTISQQLIKNTFLTNERSYERKIKEIYLSYKMTNEFDKNTIIEMYLNKISFGNNAYGIEQASKTYFAKSADSLNILESSILASIPKGPTLHSPYRFFYNKSRQRYEGYPFLMGYPYIYKKDLVDGIKTDIKRNNIIEKSKINIFPNIDISNYTKEIEAFKKVIDDIVIKKLGTEGSNILVCGLNKNNFKNISAIDNDGCTNIEYSDLLTLLNNIRVLVGDNYIEYETGRKDFILQRMFEDGYLSKDINEASQIYKDSIKRGILFDFKKSKTKIKYPHFVFYVKQFLEAKYGKTAMEEGGLKIYTTLDSKLQDKAQSIVEAQAKINFSKFGANNAASITIDNKKGEILSMIGGKDYYDKEIKGENNIITSQLQPGSTFKPFVYALAMQKKKIGPKTPVFDVKTVFPGKYTPNNFDGKFMEKVSIEKALNHSRNIPAIKMYYLAGKELVIINFMRQLGVESYYDYKKYYKEKYKKDYNYGAPMALGTGEMTPLELATAYSTIASLGNKKEITPILKILDSKGNIIYIKDRDQKLTKEAISPKTAYLITSILTNTESRPSFWNKYMTIPGRKMAAKTGTSTKQFKVNGVKKIYPQNLWTIGYTPQYTTVAWAGNTNGKELYYAGNGLEGAGPIMRNIMLEAHKGKKGRVMDSTQLN